MLLNNFRLYSGSSLVPQSFEETADLYINFLNRKHIDFSCASIVGLSFGATLAYEIMSKLYKNNVHFKNAFLIDPLFFNEIRKSLPDPASLTAADIHEKYYPARVNSNKTKIVLLKCMNEIFLEDSQNNSVEYCNVVNACVKNDSCGLKDLVNKYELVKLYCHHDQTLISPFVENVAGIINNNLLK